MTSGSDHFPSDTTGLQEAGASEVVELADTERFALRIGPVAKTLGEDRVRMLAYNGSVPGPTLRVRQGSELTVDVVNEGDLDATVHWHGLRLENDFDGTTETQAPMPIGGSFSYRLAFPDPGIYWYHPHIREDYGQEMGLYGNILVEPAEPDYWPPANRDLALTLDDVLIEGGRVAPFSRTESNYTAMGRFGNVLLTNGEPNLSLSARAGEVVRLYLTNTANTRVFNVAIPGVRMKLVGGDSGRVEREAFVETALLAPSERVVVDVLFAEPGELTLVHRTPDREYPLATIQVGEEPAEPSLTAEFEALRTNADMSAERDRVAPHLEREPDKTVSLVAEMDLGEPELPPGATVVYTCPMHPEVLSDEPGKCPDCGMKLLATAAPAAFACPMHPEVTSDQPDRCPDCGMKLVPAHLVSAAGGHEHEHHEHHEHEGGDAHGHAHSDHAHEAGGIEWEDDMVEVNRMTTPANTRWKLIDRETGAEGHEIDWRFRVGDQVKLRLLNEMDWTTRCTTLSTSMGRAAS